MIDALTVRALGAELNGTIVGGRIQQVYFIAPQVVGFEVYANHERHYLYASAEAQAARLLLVSEKLRTASVPLTPFLLLLKKYAEGAFLNRVEVMPRERILQLEFDHRQHGVARLVVELMGNRANLILVGPGGTILDAIRRAPPSVNRVRVLEPRARYVPPPPQGKADPLALSAAALGALLADAPGETLHERLLHSIAGTSPLFARELAYRVSGDAESPFDPARVPRLHEELTRTWRSPADPSIAWRDHQPAAVAAFALTHLEPFEKIPSMSSALERFYGAAESYEAVKTPIRAQLEAALAKLERRRSSLKRELVPNDEIENLKRKGEMILGYQHSIEPGQTLLRAEVDENLTLEIALDPQLSPVENANKFFDAYKRARDARAQVPERLAEVTNEIEFVQQILTDLDLAESRLEIDQVIHEARLAGLLVEPGLRTSGQTARADPRSFISPDGMEVLVGRNAQQNDALTFERAKPDDLWLHVRGRSGSHVIILSNGGQIPMRTVEYAAALAAYYSQARGETAVDVIYTPRRNVHRVRGAGARPGLVTVREERVVRVRPAAPKG